MGSSPPLADDDHWCKSSPFVDTPFPDHLPKCCFSRSREKLNQLPDLAHKDDVIDSRENPRTQTDPIELYRRSQKRKSKSRRDGTRFRTTPVTFQEIAEVDEEYCSPQMPDLNGNHGVTGPEPDQSAPRKLANNNASPSPPTLIAPPISEQPGNRVGQSKDDFFWEHFPKDAQDKRFRFSRNLPERHHRSHENLAVMKKLSLPPIPELLTPVSPTTKTAIESGFETEIL